MTPAAKARARRILKALYKEYPDAHCELDYKSPYELLIATILSAQATDVGVNKATPKLFAKFPEPADYAATTPLTIEPYVKSLGFFRMKAKAIHESMKSIESMENLGGLSPKDAREPSWPRALMEEKTLPALKDRLERDYVLHHLRRLRGDAAEVSRLLGVSRKHFYRRCQQLGIRLRDIKRGI